MALLEVTLSTGGKSVINTENMKITRIDSFGEEGCNIYYILPTGDSFEKALTVKEKLEYFIEREKR